MMRAAYSSQLKVLLDDTTWQKVCWTRHIKEPLGGSILINRILCNPLMVDWERRGAEKGRGAPH